MGQDQRKGCAGTGLNAQRKRTYTVQARGEAPSDDTKVKVRPIKFSSVEYDNSK